MTPYKNLNGNSGIVAYKPESKSITVEFNSGQWIFYKYSCDSCGSDNIEIMKGLAAQGYGLNSFIMKKVKSNYESK